MLNKGLLSAITSCFSKKNNILYYSTSSFNNLHKYLKENKSINSMQMKKEIKNIKLNKIKKEKQREKKKITIQNENYTIADYIQSLNPDINNVCPKTLTELIGRNMNVLYLIDEKTASKYVSLIIKDLLKNMCFVAELNPAFGILTKKLLKAGIPMIHLYEARQEFHPILKKIHDIYPGRLDMRNFNLINISQLLGKNRNKGEKQIQKILQDVKNKKWEDETYMQIIGATNNSSFFRHLMLSLIFRNCLMLYGRPVFYIIVPPSFWHKYTCDINNARIYTFSKVIFQIIFHYELLGILDRKAFVPLPKREKKYNRIYNQIDYDKMYVIKLEPKPDLYSELTKKDWIIFWYFIKYHMQKRTNRVISHLEHWVPNCGIRLIAKNYTVYTQFGDLTPAQILEIFKEFKSWPEYNEDNFLSSMRKYINTHNKLSSLYIENLQMEDRMSNPM